MPFGLIPAGVALVLGVIFLLTSESRPWVKFVVAATFVAGAHLQFFSAYYLVGLLIQVVLAIGLAIWMKLS